MDFTKRARFVFNTKMLHGTEVFHSNHANDEGASIFDKHVNHSKVSTKLIHLLKKYLNAISTFWSFSIIKNQNTIQFTIYFQKKNEKSKIPSASLNPII